MSILIDNNILFIRTELLYNQGRNGLIKYYTRTGCIRNVIPHVKYLIDSFIEYTFIYIKLFYNYKFYENRSFIINYKFINFFFFSNIS